ncbi:MAG: hypothetical protein LBD03_01785 [Methanobrevibacter sp.]|nr:hypothetical protein [Candidatus Methanovirga procula]
MEIKELVNDLENEFSNLEEELYILEDLLKKVIKSCVDEPSSEKEKIADEALKSIIKMLKENKKRIINSKMIFFEKADIFF